MWNNSAPTGLIFMKFDIWGFSKNLFKKFRFHSNRKRITGTLHQRDLCTFMVVSPWILLRMRNVSDRSYRANHNTHFIFHKVFPKVITHAEKYGPTRQPIDDNIVWRMYFSYWIITATDTLRIFNTYCFLPATMDTWTLLNTILYVHCPSCLCIFSNWSYISHLLFFLESSDCSCLVFFPEQIFCWRKQLTHIIIHGYYKSNSMWDLKVLSAVNIKNYRPSGIL
jgi:hypothetical protein